MKKPPAPRKQRAFARAELATPAAIRKLKYEMQILEIRDAAARAAARRQLISSAHDLMPKATALARKGRPRLLAIVAKIIGDPKLRAAT